MYTLHRHTSFPDFKKAKWTGLMFNLYSFATYFSKKILFLFSNYFLIVKFLYLLLLYLFSHVIRSSQPNYYWCPRIVKINLVWYQNVLSFAPYKVITLNLFASFLYWLLYVGTWLLFYVIAVATVPFCYHLLNRERATTIEIVIRVRSKELIP